MDTKNTYSDTLIMKALLLKDFSLIGNGFEDSALTAIKKCAFQGAGATLHTVSLPLITRIPTAAFRSCTGITSLDIAWSSITGIDGDAFRDAKIPSTALTGSRALSVLTYIGDGAFSACNGLTQISCPSCDGAGGTEPQYGSTASGVFRDCTTLTKASFPALRTTAQYFFRGCTGLTEVTLTALTQVGGNTFQGCTSIEKIVLPAAVANLSGNVFNGCTNLTAVVLSGITSAPSMTSSTFTGSPIASGTCYVYVPEEMLSTMKSASGWSTYADMIRSISDYPGIAD